MEITEVRIKLMEDSGDRLRAFCSITLDSAFVIRDLKIIEGPNGLFVAMPSRKLSARCTNCGCKNHLRAAYCNHCGSELDSLDLPHDDEGRTKLHADVAHPINSTCREMIQSRLLEALEEEQERAMLPGYVSNYYEDDLGEDIDYGPSQSEKPSKKETMTVAYSQAHRAPQGPHRSRVQESSGSRKRSSASDSFGAGIL
ncbi:Stage V sporulation protein G [Planctomycetales bacterium 10988]|nr:Stage V sporulation protein G [Planctomycetales bacterium 10988]